MFSRIFFACPSVFHLFSLISELVTFLWFGLFSSIAAILTRESAGGDDHDRVRVCDFQFSSFYFSCLGELIVYRVISFVYFSATNRT